MYIRRGHDGMSLLPKNATNVLPKPFPRHCDIDDMDEVAQYLKKQYPNAPMLAIGFSAGSNIVAQYMGKYHDRSPFVAGVSVCNGYDVNDVTIELEDNRCTSDKILLYYMKKMLHERLDEVKQIALMHKIDVDWSAVYAAKSVRSFEAALLVPLYGHKDVIEFYQHNSSVAWLADIKVPMLCLSNWDDPIIARHLPHHAINASKVNPNVIAVVTERGGHLSWFEGLGVTWAAKAINPFLEYVVNAHMTCNKGVRGSYRR